MATPHELRDRLLFSVKQMDDLQVCCDGSLLTEEQSQAVDGFYDALNACRKNGLSRRAVFDMLLGMCSDPAIENNDVVYEEVTVLQGACSVDCIPRWRFQGEPEEDRELVNYVRDGKWKVSSNTGNVTTDDERELGKNPMSGREDAS